MSDFVVICKTDVSERDASEGEYVAATRRLFATSELALTYAQTIAPSRAARVVRSAEYLMLCDGWSRVRPRKGYSNER